MDPGLAMVPYLFPQVLMAGEALVESARGSTCGICTGKQVFQSFPGPNTTPVLSGITVS